MEVQLVAKIRSKFFANSWPSASNFKSFFRLLEQFFLTVDQNNFGNKIPSQLFTYFAMTNQTNSIIRNLIFGINFRSFGDFVN
jgi:hypothetical protein